jgi:hypothetical protein
MLYRLADVEPRTISSARNQRAAVTMTANSQFLEQGRSISLYFGPDESRGQVT